MPTGIRIYGTGWCGLTFGLRKYLTSARLPYDYYNIEQDPAADDFVRAMHGGKRLFPIVVVEDCILTNPTLSQLEQVLDDNGVRRISVR
jgi:disulfide oxidoreductase YuzD